MRKQAQFWTALQTPFWVSGNSSHVGIWEMVTQVSNNIKILPFAHLRFVHLAVGQFHLIFKVRHHSHYLGVLEGTNSSSLERVNKGRLLSQVLIFICCFILWISMWLQLFLGFLGRRPWLQCWRKGIKAQQPYLGFCYLISNITYFPILPHVESTVFANWGCFHWTGWIASFSGASNISDVQ